MIAPNQQPIYNQPQQPTMQPSMMNTQLAGVEREIQSGNQQFAAAEQRLIMIWQMAEQLGYRLTRDPQNGLLRPLTPEEVNKRQAQMQQPQMVSPDVTKQIEQLTQGMYQIMQKLNMPTQSMGTPPVAKA